MSNKGSPIYPRHRLHTLEPYYSQHVAAMTEIPGKQEGLHSKSDIAEQLAWRDQKIARLQDEIGRLAYMSPEQSKLEALTQAAVGALGFLPRNDPGARMAAERIEAILAQQDSACGTADPSDGTAEPGLKSAAAPSVSSSVAPAVPDTGLLRDPEPASEPRAIVVNSTWRHDISRAEVIVQGTDERSVHIMWLNTSDRRAWPIEAFRKNFTHVSDPSTRTSGGGEAGPK